jgi:hypothetical protein
MLRRIGEVKTLASTFALLVCKCNSLSAQYVKLSRHQWCKIWKLLLDFGFDDYRISSFNFIVCKFASKKFKGHCKLLNFCSSTIFIFFLMNYSWIFENVCSWHFNHASSLNFVHGPLLNFCSYLFMKFCFFKCLVNCCLIVLRFFMHI